MIIHLNIYFSHSACSLPWLGVSNSSVFTVVIEIYYPHAQMPPYNLVSFSVMFFPTQERKVIGTIWAPVRQVNEWVQLPCTIQFARVSMDQATKTPNMHCCIDLQPDAFALIPHKILKQINSFRFCQRKEPREAMKKQLQLIDFAYASQPKW